MLEECYKILANLFYECYTCLRMLTKAVANLTNALRMKRQHDACVAYLHIHIAAVSLCLLFARLCPISYFPIILLLIVRILSLYFENINTNGSETLQTSCDHYKCVAIDLKWLATASEYVAKNASLRILGSCF